MPKGPWDSIPTAAGDYQTATATLLTVSLVAPASSTAYHTIGQVTYSYSATPTGGTLTITDGVSTFSFDIAAGGPGYVAFAQPLRFGAGLPVTVTLSSGGGSVVGKLHVQHWVE